MCTSTKLSSASFTSVMEKEAKRRKPNWCEGELITLAESVLPKVKMLKGKFSPFLTSEKKQELWQDIADQVNASSTTHRTVEEMKKKWADMQSLTKKKEGERRKSLKLTGGGPATNMTFKTWENLVLQSLSDVAIEGIPNGVDTAECVREASSMSMAAEIPFSDPTEPGPSIQAKNPSPPTGLIITEVPECELSQTATTPARTCEELYTPKEKESRPKTNKKQPKRQMNEVEECSAEYKYFCMEKEKMEKLDLYRKRKLEVMEEMLKLQQQSTAALEKIAASFLPSGGSPPLSLTLSPVIKF